MHRVADGLERGPRDRPDGVGAGRQHLADETRRGFQRGSAFPERGEPLDEMVGKDRLAVDAAELARAARRLDTVDSSGENFRCSAKTGQISGRPGSPLRSPWGSVMNDRTVARTAASSSRTPIVLSRDFDIFRPSDPGINGESDSRGCGSSSTSP